MSSEEQDQEQGQGQEQEQGQGQEQEQGQGQEQEQGQEQGQDRVLAYACLATPYFPGFSIMSPSMRPTSSESEMIGAISC